MFLKWKNRHYVCSCYPSQDSFEALGPTWNASLWTGASGHRGASYPSTSAKKGGVSKEDGGRNAREKQYLWASQQTYWCTSSNEALVLAVLLDLHSRRDIWSPQVKAIAKIFLWLAFGFATQMSSPLLTWQCVPFCSLTSGRTLWYDFV